jgi:2-polyprenyl-3-methyl-5-hydroxy-6-metoxy-1,4-benzoquinol methylase
MVTTRDIACPVCTDGARYRIVTVRWGVRIVKCLGCGLTFANPQPASADVEQYYDPQYFEQNAAKFLRFPLPDEVALRFDRYLGALRSVCPVGRVLDVGCGTGAFLTVARGAGYETKGIELSPYASQLGRERLGLDIRTGRLEELESPVPFDVITMWDFLEHISDPVEILRAARRLLADDGHLLMTVPNVGSWWARAMGPRWVGFDKASEHLFYFTEKSLTGMLERAGFEPVKVEPHAWVCTAEFIAQRSAKLWRPAGRLLGQVLVRTRQQRRVVRFPSVNLLAVARKKADRSA